MYEDFLYYHLLVDEIKKNIHGGEILRKTGKELKLFWNKKDVKVDDKIGSFGYECLEIVALDPKDKKAMKDYFREGQDTDSDDESSNDEDVDDIMEGIGIFD